VLITPHLVKPLTPDEKAKLPDYPVTFLPSNTEVKRKERRESRQKEKRLTLRVPVVIRIRSNAPRSTGSRTKTAGAAR